MSSSYSAYLFNDTNIRVFLSHAYSYSGLVSFWVGREKNDKKWIARGVECKDEIEKLAASASIWNFQNSECRILHVIFLPNITIDLTLLSILHHVHRGLSSPGRRTIL